MKCEPSACPSINAMIADVEIATQDSDRVVLRDATSGRLSPQSQAGSLLKELLVTFRVAIAASQLLFSNATKREDVLAELLHLRLFVKHGIQQDIVHPGLFETHDLVCNPLR
jgi:hypothetical protein